LGIGFLLIVSLLLSTVLALFSKYIGHLLPLSEALYALLNGAISFLIMSLMFALMFKFLPDIKITWRSVWLGAVGTSLFFTIGKTAIGLYLGKQAFDSAYGAASSLAVVLAWAYYLAQVLFFGAEFTKVYARSRGDRVEPTVEAVRVPPRSAKVEAPKPH
jgi:membrane protein